MSLSDLKEWLDDPQARLSLGAENKERASLPPKLEMAKHQSAMEDIGGKGMPLNELTNRMTARTQRANSFVSIPSQNVSKENNRELR